MTILYSQPFDEIQDQLEGQIETVLRRLGISGKLIGHKYLTTAIAQTTLNPSRIPYITKDLYPDLAKLYGSKPSRVERGIRTAISSFWKKGNKELFESMVGFLPSQRPTNTEFIDLLAHYFRQHQ